MPAEAKSNDFVISRLLDAPRSRVWQAFTGLERMKQWWGPKGFTVIDGKMDLRPGGIFHYSLRSADGFITWAKFTYREIVAPERLVYMNALSDEAGGTTRHPIVPTWPLELLTTITLEEQPGGKTKLTVRWSPHNATVEECKTFNASHEIMRQGWDSTLDRLVEYLAKA